MVIEMENKIIKLLSIVILLSFFASLGRAIELRSHSVEISINEDATAEVQERFSFRLSGSAMVQGTNLTQEEYFNQIVSEAGKNFDKLTELHPDVDIAPSVIGERRDIVISTSETYRTHNLVISYETDELINLVREEGRINHYRFNKEALEFYEHGTDMVRLGDNTNLLIDLPETIEEDRLDPPRDPWMVHGGNEYQWTTGTWDIDIEYSVVEPITSWSPGGIWETFKDMFISDPVYGIILLILIALSVIYRKEIKLLFSEGLVAEEEPKQPREQL